MRQLLALLVYLLSFSCFAAGSSSSCMVQACPDAGDIKNPQFCQKFITSAHCHCGNHLPQSYCNTLTMEKLYQMMLDSTRERNLESACRKQTDVPYATCVKNWTYYRNNC